MQLSANKLVCVVQCFGHSFILSRSSSQKGKQWYCGCCGMPSLDHIRCISVRVRPSMMLDSCFVFWSRLPFPLPPHLCDIAQQHWPKGGHQHLRPMTIAPRRQGNRGRIPGQTGTYAGPTCYQRSNLHLRPLSAESAAPCHALNHSLLPNPVHSQLQRHEDPILLPSRRLPASWTPATQFLPQLVPLLLNKKNG